MLFFFIILLVSKKIKNLMSRCDEIGLKNNIFTLRRLAHKLRC